MLTLIFAWKANSMGEMENFPANFKVKQARYKTHRKQVGPPPMASKPPLFLFEQTQFIVGLKRTSVLTDKPNVFGKLVRRVACCCLIVCCCISQMQMQGCDAPRPSNHQTPPIIAVCSSQQLKI